MAFLAIPGVVSALGGMGLSDAAATAAAASLSGAALGAGAGALSGRGAGQGALMGAGAGGIGDLLGGLVAGGPTVAASGAATAAPEVAPLGAAQMGAATSTAAPSFWSKLAQQGMGAAVNGAVGDAFRPKPPVMFGQNLQIMNPGQLQFQRLQFPGATQ